MVIGEIEDIETFATGHGIRELRRLRRNYGPGRWRKRKGVAMTCQTGSCRGQSYTGTKPPASAVEN